MNDGPLSGAALTCAVPERMRGVPEKSQNVFRRSLHNAGRIAVIFPVKTPGSCATWRGLAVLLCWLACGRVSAGAASEAECAITLEAIHKLENPWNVTRPGPHGELGPYQFRESTWRRHTSEPFVRALDPQLSNLIAVRHYEWIRLQLERAGIVPSVYNIALAWNGGLASVLSGRVSAAARNYAERASNLAETFANGSPIAGSR